MLILTRTCAFRLRDVTPSTPRPFCFKLKCDNAINKDGATQLNMYRKEMSIVQSVSSSNATVDVYNRRRGFVVEFCYRFE